MVAPVDQITIEARDFLLAIQTGQPVWPRFRDRMEVNRVNEAAHISHTTRQGVEIVAIYEIGISEKARLNWGMIGGGDGSQIGPAYRLGAGLGGAHRFVVGALDHDAARGRAFAE